VTPIGLVVSITAPPAAELEHAGSAQATPTIMMTLDAPRGVRKELTIRATSDLVNLAPSRRPVRLSVIRRPSLVRIRNITLLGSLPQAVVELVVAPLIKRSSLLHSQRRVRSEQGAKKSNTPKRLAQAALPKREAPTLKVCPSRTIAPETPDADERKGEDQGRHLEDDRLQE